MPRQSHGLTKDASTTSRQRRPRTIGLRDLTRQAHSRRRTRASATDEVDDESCDADVGPASGAHAARPSCRAECRTLPRPCPFVSCRYHLGVDVTDTGSLKINFPDRSTSDLPSTCALDVAERGGQSLEEVGSLLNITRERARQIEVAALRKIWAALHTR